MKLTVFGVISFIIKASAQAFIDIDYFAQCLCNDHQAEYKDNRTHFEFKANTYDKIDNSTDVSLVFYSILKVLLFV